MKKWHWIPPRFLGEAKDEWYWGWQEKFVYTFEVITGILGIIVLVVFILASPDLPVYDPLVRYFGWGTCLGWTAVLAFGIAIGSIPGNIIANLLTLVISRFSKRI